MADNTEDQSNDMARKLVPKVKRKVKTGCRTCKLRKVKCDEGRPACRRCVSTGRVCDGYGIWGGGGNAYHERSYAPASKPASTQIIAKSQPESGDEFTCFGFTGRTKVPRKISPLGSISTEELGYLEWYTRRSATKLPGIFSSAFWDTLVLRSCLHEPAILHAVMALSAIHKSDHFNFSTAIRHQEEQFALREYTKAITYLQHECSSKTKESRRVAMITCLLFVCFEFLRSHYRTGFAHLESGLRLLKETQAHTSRPAGPWTILHPSPDTIDTVIFETFASMHVQAELLGQHVRDLKIILHTTDTEAQGEVFSGVDHAKMALDKILHGTLLFYETRGESVRLGRVEKTPLAIDAQRRAQAALWSWHETYKRTTRGFPRPSHLSQRETFAYKLLRIYHLMAGILADTSLVPTSESRFDTYACEFAKMVRKSKELHDIVKRFENGASELDASVRKLMEAHDESAGRNTCVTGTIPPLFFVVVKCRSHHIRHSALSLLKAMDHKEGIWDSKLAADFAEEVVRIEERGFYDTISTPTSIGDDQEVVMDPEILDAGLPPLPELYRLPDVEAILPDSSHEKMKLAYKQLRDDGRWISVVREYESVTNCWVQCSLAPGMKSSSNPQKPCPIRQR